MEFVKLSDGCVDAISAVDVFGPADVRAMCDGYDVEVLAVGQDGWYIVFHISNGFGVQIFRNHKRSCRELAPESICIFIEEVREEWKKLLWEAAKNL